MFVCVWRGARRGNRSSRQGCAYILYVCVCISLSLSIYIYICMYINKYIAGGDDAVHVVAGGKAGKPIIETRVRIYIIYVCMYLYLYI